jgi:hypothetical protein
MRKKLSRDRERVLEEDSFSALYVDDDCVPHVDRHHIGSSPDGARPEHEWIHRCTFGTHSPRLRHVYFSRSNDRRALDMNRF